MGPWDDYFASTRGLPVHPIYSALQPHLPVSGTALELGCGVGTGARWLADQGLHVTAIDALLDKAAPVASPGVTYHQAYIQELGFARSSFDVVVAGFCLFFLRAQELEAFWPRMQGWLKPHGVFAGQFLGPRDDWAGEYLSQSRDDLKELLHPFATLHMEEVERDGRTSQGTPKHWHVVHFIGRLL